MCFKNYTILSLIVGLSLIGCGSKKKSSSNPPPIPDGEDGSEVPGPITPDPSGKPNPTVEPQPDPVPKVFTVQACAAKFWTFNFTYYSMLVVKPSIPLMALDLTVNGSSVKSSSNGSFSVASMGSFSTNDMSILQDIDANGGNLAASFGYNFASNYSGSLIFFAKQHPYVSWANTSIKFIYDGGGEIDLSTVCPPLPFLPQACTPNYQSVDFRIIR